MFTARSQTMSEDYKSEAVPLKQWKFQISNGNTGEMVVSDPLLDTEERAEERAKSEFLKNSYKLKEVRFGTYRTDILKNQIINVRGLPYIAKSIVVNTNMVSIKNTIRAVRYE